MIVGNSTRQSQPGWTLATAIRRHRLIFSASIAIGAFGGVAIWLVTPNRYIAESVVALDSRKVQVITIDSVVSRLPQDSPVVRTELDLIASRSMAQRVADRLRLSPSGNPEQAPTGIMAGLFGGTKPPVELDRSSSSSAVDELVSGLRVNNDGRSYTIFITFEARDPAFARRVANAYSEAYLDHQVSLQSDATRTASDWLGRKVADLGARLEISEIATEEMRRRSGLIESKGETSEGQRLAGANVELAAARSQRAGAEARLAAAQELKQGGINEAAFTEALTSVSIQALRVREAEIGRGIDAIEASGAAMSTDLPQQRLQLTAVRRQIDGEVKRVIASLANEVDVARRKQRSIEQDVAKLEADVARNGEARVELNRLERESAANRTIYESFLNRYKQTIEQQGLATPDAKLLSSAELPTRPSSPKFLPLIAFGAISGAIAGAGLAALRRRADEPKNGDLSQDELTSNFDCRPLDLARSLQPKRS